MLMSIRGVAKGAYEQFHLAIAEQMDAVEEEHVQNVQLQEENSMPLPAIQVEPVGKSRIRDRE